MTKGARVCPICKTPVAAPAENRWFPFCSGRCKTLDLGRWLSGDYAIPVREEDESGGGGSDGGAAGDGR